MHFVFELVAPRTSDGVSTDVFNNEHNPFPKIGVTWYLTFEIVGQTIQWPKVKVQKKSSKKHLHHTH
jgi:hypothetical protein